jgi:hypothetical protein
MNFRRPLMLASAFVAALPAVLAAQGGGRGGPQEPPKNLQVLPKDMPRQQVTAIMNNFTAALGVNCAYCHAAAAAPAGAAPAAAAPAAPAGGGRGGPPLDYSLDDKAQKKVAREMLKMVTDINGKYLTGAGLTMDARNSVTCETCHRGLAKPKTLRNALGGAIDAKGADSAVALYRELRTRYFGAAAYDFSENSLVAAATDASRANKTPVALALLKLNLEFYDKSVATYSAIANTSLAGNDTASAITALKKAIELQPTNQQAQGLLTRLMAKPPQTR